MRYRFGACRRVDVGSKELRNVWERSGSKGFFRPFRGRFCFTLCSNQCENRVSSRAPTFYLPI